MKQKADKFLQIVRREMANQKLGALIVPTSDPHNSEYVADRYQYRAKLSNFYGSAGTAVVTPTEAHLWTDGRYWLEAAASLPDGWTLQKSGAASVPSLEDWLETQQVAGQFKEFGLSVGVDPYTYDVKSWENLSAKVPLKPSEIAKNAAAEAESSAVSAESLLSPIFVRSGEFCGATTLEKLQQVAEKVSKLTTSPQKPIDAILLTALDDIAWLTNMRGVSDIPYNPVFISYAVVDFTAAANASSNNSSSSSRAPTLHLFVDYCEAQASHYDSFAQGVNHSTQVSVVDYCKANNIILHSYNDIQVFLKSEYVAQGKIVGVEERQTNYALFELLSSSSSCGTRTAITTKRIPSIISNLKGVKNSTELKGFEDCHVRDGCALVRFMAWLTNEIRKKPSSESSVEVRETDASDKVAYFRSQEPNYRGPSFATISSSGPNGAVIHYHPKKTSPPSDRVLKTEELYLVDSGGQYEDGTTDVTRVLTFAEGSDIPGEHITAYTLVLKGHVALASAVFPQGVAGYRLDALARQFLWADGLDYAHGTGHGVGSFLCVHEGPHGCHSRLPTTSVPLLEGMILSNEPGYYEDGSYGIRIENLVYVAGADGNKMRFPSAKTLGSPKRPEERHSTQSLAFKQLTMVPFNRDLIDKSMLTAQEIAFVNAYHEAVKGALTPLIEAHGDALALDYLKKHTAML